MKVFYCPMSGGYSGGGIMVAAETKEQAFLTAARDKKTSYAFSWWVGDWVMNKSGATFSNGSISARVQRIEGHKIWLEHGTYVKEWELKKLTD